MSLLRKGPCLPLNLSLSPPALSLLRCTLPFPSFKVSHSLLRALICLRRLFCLPPRLVIDFPGLIELVGESFVRCHLSRLLIHKPCTVRSRSHKSSGRRLPPPKIAAKVPLNQNGGAPGQSLPDNILSARIDCRLCLATNCLAHLQILRGHVCCGKG